MALIATISKSIKVEIPNTGNLLDLCSAFNSGQHPSLIEFTRDGRFYRVTRRSWDE